MKLDVTIGELSPGGDGVAIVEVAGERRAIFASGVALGERVELDVDLKKRPARGRLLRILSPSPRRVEPACAFTATCGGCDWMMLDAEAQAAGHAAIVKGILPEPKDPIVHAAPQAFGYRARARLHVASEKRGGVLVGMFAPRSHEPVPVTTCVVLDPALDALRAALPALLDGAKGRGEARIALGARLPVLDLTWSGELPAAVFARVEKAIGVQIDGARLYAGDVKIPARIGDPTPWMQGADDLPLALGPGGFSQTSSAGNALLAKRVFALAAERAPEGAPLLELYAGAGNLTVLFAKRFAVTAVEFDAEACAAAQRNLTARSLTAKVLARDAATFAIPNVTPKLVVLDPPRTGARDVARTLATSRVPTVIYVSCDPATLARDLEVMNERYAVQAVETFELFPQTSHVETVVVLTRRK